MHQITKYYLQKTANPNQNIFTSEGFTDFMSRIMPPEQAPVQAGPKSNRIGAGLPSNLSPMEQLKLKASQGKQKFDDLKNEYSGDKLQNMALNTLGDAGEGIYNFLGSLGEVGNEVTPQTAFLGSRAKSRGTNDAIAGKEFMNELRGKRLEDTITQGNRDAFDMVGNRIQAQSQALEGQEFMNELNRNRLEKSIAQGNRDAFDMVGNRIQGHADDLREMLKSRGEELNQEPDLISELMETGSSTLEDIQANPGAAMAGAGGLGALALLNRRLRPRRMPVAPPPTLMQNLQNIVKRNPLAALAMGVGGGLLGSRMMGGGQQTPPPPAMYGYR